MPPLDLFQSLLWLCDAKVPLAQTALSSAGTTSIHHKLTSEPTTHSVCLSVCFRETLPLFAATFFEFWYWGFLFLFSLHCCHIHMSINTNIWSAWNVQYLYFKYARASINICIYIQVEQCNKECSAIIHSAQHTHTDTRTPQNPFFSHSTNVS